MHNDSELSIKVVILLAANVVEQPASGALPGVAHASASCLNDVFAVRCARSIKDVALSRALGPVPTARMRLRNRGKRMRRPRVSGESRA
jgi:hypothetical protein